MAIKRKNFELMLADKKPSDSGQTTTAEVVKVLQNTDCDPSLSPGEVQPQMPKVPNLPRDNPAPSRNKFLVTTAQFDYDKVLTFLENFEEPGYGQMPLDYFLLCEAFFTVYGGSKNVGQLAGEIATKYPEDALFSNLYESLLGSSQQTSISLKACISLSQDGLCLSGHSNIFQFVLQNVLFIIGKANYEYLQQTSQTQILEKLRVLTNSEYYLQEKFEKLMQVVQRKNENPENTNLPTDGPSNSLFQDGPVPEKSHYNLLKILLNHLVFYVERDIGSFDCETYFSARDLAKKNCIYEFQRTIGYVLKNIANSVPEFKFPFCVMEFLFSIRLVLRFSKSKPYKVNFLRTIKGFYGAAKYDNTTQQVVAGLMIMQMI